MLDGLPRGLEERREGTGAAEAERASGLTWGRKMPLLPLAMMQTCLSKETWNP